MLYNCLGFLIKSRNDDMKFLKLDVQMNAHQKVSEWKIWGLIWGKSMIHIRIDWRGFTKCTLQIS